MVHYSKILAKKWVFSQQKCRMSRTLYFGTLRWFLHSFCGRWGMQFLNFAWLSNARARARVRLECQLAKQKTWCIECIVVFFVTSKTRERTIFTIPNVQLRQRNKNRRRKFSYFTWVSNKLFRTWSINDLWNGPRIKTFLGASKKPVFCLQIQMVVNEGLYKSYQNQWDVLKAKLKSVHNIHESFLFHGTDPSTFDKICANGFDRSFGQVEKYGMM